VANRLSALHGLKVFAMAQRLLASHGMEVVAMAWLMLSPWHGKRRVDSVLDNINY
jgi:hypothetical protein